MDPTAMVMGASLLPSIIGGGKVSVPGAMAKPTDPSENILDKNSFVKGPFSLSSQVDPNQTEAQGLLGNLKSIATQEGPTSIAQRMMDANKQEANAQRDMLNANQASQQATQSANLAMKSGLGSGSRERMNNSMANANVMANQGINQQASLNNLNTLAQDEERKFGLLQNLPSQYMDMARFDTGKKEFDISNSIGTATNSYNQQMGAYAGNQLARQQAKSYNASNKGLLGGLF